MRDTNGTAHLIELPGQGYDRVVLQNALWAPSRESVKQDGDCRKWFFDSALSH